MAKVDWFRDLPGRIQEEGLRKGMKHSAWDVQNYILKNINSIDIRGQYIYEKDWEILIILDACRADLLNSVSSDYDFLPTNSVPTIWSKASCSRLWMDSNFTTSFRDEMSQTIYVTGNPYSEDHLKSHKFNQVDEVWKYAWDNEKGTIPPRPITDRAIGIGRQQEFERLIIHYMQPHFPSIPAPLESRIDIETFGDGWDGDSIWDRLRDGQIDQETVWNSYEQNLRYVLDEVSILLNNIDAKDVIISADHGNAFGEWGHYGHPPKIPIRVLREVPWVRISSKDHETHSPQIKTTREQITDTMVEERLENLGYK